MRRLALACLILAALTAPASALFSLSGFRNTMIEFLIDQLSTEGEMEITVEEITDTAGGATEIRGLAIADADGIWLRAEALQFAWNPSRLISGEVEFENLEMQGLRVLRRPLAQVEAEAPIPDDDTALIPEIAWPRSPLTLRIVHMGLTDVQIAEPVLGHAIAFDAEGSAQDEGDVQAVDLTVVRTDAVPGQIAIDYERLFSTSRLRVNVSAEEGAGGLIPALSALPADAASRLDLRANGPPEDWRLTLDLTLAETIEATGSATIAYQGPLAIDARFSASPGPQLDPQLAALLGENAAIVAVLNEGADTTIEIVEGRITSPDLNLVAEGTFTRATATADLGVELTAGAPLADPFDGVDFGGLQFTGRITGAPGSFAADGDLTLDALATEQVDVARAELDIDVRQETPESEDAETTTRLDIAGLTRGLRLDRIAAETVGEASIVLAGTLTGSDLRLSRLFLDSEPLDVAASGQANIETQAANFELALAAPDFAPVASAYGVDVEGGLALTGRVTHRNARTEADVDLRLTRFEHPAAAADRLAVTATVVQNANGLAFTTDGTARALRVDRIGPDLLPQARLAAEGTLVEDVLDLAATRLSSPLLAVTAAGTLDTATNRGELDYTVATPDLGPVARLYDQPATGALDAEGRATLDGDAPPQLDGRLALAGLTYDGTAYGRLSLTHDVLVSATPSGTLKLVSEGSPYGAARVATGFALAEQVLTLTGFDAAALGAAINGDLAANLDRPTAEGRLEIRASDLSRLRPVTGTALGGAGQGMLVLSAPGGQQNANLNFRLANLRSGDARVKGARIEAALANLLGTPTVRATVTATDIHAGEARMSTARVIAQGPLSQMDVGAEARGALGDKAFSLDTSARVDAATPTVRATIARLEARLAEDAVVLNRPLAVTSSGGTVSLRGLDAAFPQGGRLSGNVAYHRGPVSGALEISAPDLTVLNRLAGVPLSKGALDAQASFDTRRARAEATITGRGVRFTGVEAGGDLDLQSTLTWAGRQANVDATLVGEFGNPLSVSATLPVAVRGGLPAPARRGPISAAIKWQGDIEQFWALVPAPGHILTGQADIDLGVTGDISAPKLTGGIALTNGGYQNLDAGTILMNLTLGTSLAGDGNLQLDLSASDGATGTVEVGGRVALDASGLDITARLNRAILVRRDDAVARLDGAVSIKGPMTALAVTGEVTIAEAEIRLVNANPPEIVTLEEVLIKGASPPEAGAGESSVRLDLRVNSPGRMFVRGRGLESEWMMDLAIRGDAASPRITGSIEKVRGTLDLIGKGFDLSRGQVVFDGGPKIDPRVDVVLERDTGDIVGRIVVDGFASDPQLGFSSSPSLPEDEVLPRTLFGKSRQGLTGSQAIQLALGLATLMDGGGGTLDKVRGAIGLDQLRIKEDDDGNAAVGLGKEVAEGVWVGSRQSLGGDGGTSVAVEVDIFEGIQLDAEIERGGNSSVGIQWKRDF